jgi:hypothetical protein
MQLPKRPDGLTCYLTLLTVVVLERSKTEIMSSNLARGMDISPRFLARGLFPAEAVLPKCLNVIIASEVTSESQQARGSNP